MITASEICFLTATELLRLVRAKELSALEVMEAHLAQIERVNPEVNAIVTLTAEQAMDRARATDDAIARGEEVESLARPPVAKRTELFHRMRSFMQSYEFLISPVSQVPPFDVEQRYVTEIDGERMETYIDWMKSCYYVTVAGLPAASVPCGFTPEGLPVGAQIVGRFRDDFGVLQLAHAFEEATRHGERRPPLAG